jgi:hypothetical protein
MRPKGMCEAMFTPLERISKQLCSPSKGSRCLSDAEGAWRNHLLLPLLTDFGGFDFAAAQCAAANGDASRPIFTFDRSFLDYSFIS